MARHRRALLLVITAFFWFSAYTYIPTLGPYAKSLGASYDMIGLIVGAYGAVQLLLRVPIGLSCDAWGWSKAYVVAGSALVLASAVGMWVWPEVWMLLVGRTLAGIAAATWVAYSVLFASYYPQGDGPKAMGFLNSASNLGQVAALFLGGLVAELYGMTGPFLLAAGGGAIALALSLFVRGEPSPAKPVDTAVLAEILRDRVFLRICGLGILFQVFSHATVFGFTPLAAKAIGASNFELGLLTTLTILPAIVAAALSGTYLRRRLGDAGTLAAGFAFTGLSSITIPLCDSMAALYLSQMAGGFGRGALMALLMGLCIKNSPVEQRATAMGLYQAIYAGGMFAGPVITGFLAGWFDLNSSFIVIGLAGFAGAWLALRPGFLAAAGSPSLRS
jgi:MFS family permease